MKVYLTGDHDNPMELEDLINKITEDEAIKVIDIKYQTAWAPDSERILHSALIVYKAN